MLPRRLLIPLRKEYPHLRKIGRWRDSISFRLLIWDHRLRHSDKITRFAIIVSKKVSLLSTERHEIKRLVSDAVSGLLDSLPSGMDVVILVKKEALGKTTDVLKAELEFLLTHST